MNTNYLNLNYDYFYDYATYDEYDESGEFINSQRIIYRRYMNMSDEQKKLFIRRIKNLSFYEKVHECEEDEYTGRCMYPDSYEEVKRFKNFQEWKYALDEMCTNIYNECQ